jgi:hypothetical protein
MSNIIINNKLQYNLGYLNQYKINLIYFIELLKLEMNCVN